MHLRVHADHYKEYEEETANNMKTPIKKRKLDLNQSPTTPVSLFSPQSLISSSLSRSHKYKIFSSIQKERFNKLLIMLVKCMLPISIVENAAFRDYISYLDPSFNIPCVYTVKYRGLNELKMVVTDKIKEVLKSIPYPNVASDIWTDKVQRGFTAFKCQGLDHDFNLHKIMLRVAVSATVTIALSPLSSPS